MDPLQAVIEALESAAAVALKARDLTTVTALVQLIGEHLRASAAAQPPKVASLEEARKRRDENGGGK